MPCPSLSLLTLYFQLTSEISFFWEPLQVTDVKNNFHNLVLVLGCGIFVRYYRMLFSGLNLRTEVMKVASSAFQKASLLDTR